MAIFNLMHKLAESLFGLPLIHFYINIQNEPYVFRHRYFSPQHVQDLALVDLIKTTIGEIIVPRYQHIKRFIQKKVEGINNTICYRQQNQYIYSTPPKETYIIDNQPDTMWQ